MEIRERLWHKRENLAIFTLILDKIAPRLPSLAPQLRAPRLSVFANGGMKHWCARVTHDPVVATTNSAELLFARFKISDTSSNSGT